MTDEAARSRSGPRRTIVYFAFLGEDGGEDALIERRLGFLEVQLRWLAELAAISPHPVDGVVAYVGPRHWDAAVHHLISRYGFRVDPVSVLSDRRNRYEYPGFRAMKALAVEAAPNDLIFYCHSKGMPQLSPGKMGMFRLHTAVCLGADLDRLIADPTLTKAGLFPSRWGWCWYNFFWIKAGHMAGLSVEERTDRYYYEALIGDGADKEGFRSVLPLIGLLSEERRGIAPRPWYRPMETTSPELDATYALYAALPSPPTGG